MSCVAAKVTQLSIGHLATLLRYKGSEQLRASVEQDLLQAPLLFRGSMWAAVAAAKLWVSTSVHTLLTTPDAPNPDYYGRPPWAPATFTATIRPLPTKKATLTPHRLTREARKRELDAARP